MIRVATFLVIVGLIALGVTWIADRPGDVAVTWLGWHIETSIMVLLAAVLVLVAACIFIWSLLRGLMRSPGHISSAFRGRRAQRGQRAIANGLIAVGAGDARAARRYAEEVQRLAPHEPLALLLSAQAAQLTGDRSAAERAFREMAGHDQTKLLGLRGLFIEAQRHGDLANARRYAEEAAKIAPSLPWAGQAVLQIQCATGDYAGALDMLERNRASGALDRNVYRRHRAVLLTARAQALRESDRDAAKAYAFEAVKLAPDLVPAAALAARFLAEDGDYRKATRIIERAWQTQPHPDLAETYAYLRFGDSARDRLTRVRKLAGLKPEHVESALALARASIDAREFAEARRALAPWIAQPTQRVALLMADLEQADSSDEGRSREWTARAVHATRDPAWIADGFVSERWIPISPVSGQIDAFEWKTPATEIASAPSATKDVDPAESAAVPVIDMETPAALDTPAPAPAPANEKIAAIPKPAVEAVAPAMAATAPAASKPVPVRPLSPLPAAETVVPVNHVPDDPGPEPDQEREPVPEPTSTAPGWKRLFMG